MWNQKYQSDSFFYGTEPNGFLKSVAPLLPQGGKALSLAEGEGRNAVFLAQQGFDVLGVDSSTVGLQKAHRLAAEQGVNIETQCIDLADFPILPNHYDLINIIFCHLPLTLRQHVFHDVAKGLKSGGALVLELYSTEQLHYKTGGPKDPELLMTLAEIEGYFSQLSMPIKQKIVRPIFEGQGHTGLSSVIQVFAFKA